MAESESFIMADAQRCTVYPQHVLVNKGRREWLDADLFECECGRRVIGNTDESKVRAGRK